MQSLDCQVLDQTCQWLASGQTVWLCTVLSTFGSSPREPGSMLAATAAGQHIGSLSGGCVEEDFLERLTDGEFRNAVVRIRYGDANGPDRNPRVSLPCGGVLDVLVERIEANDANHAHCKQLLDALSGHELPGFENLARRINLTTGDYSLTNCAPNGPRIEIDDNSEAVCIRIGAVATLILAGYSTVSQACASYAVSLGYRVILCDPRAEVTSDARIPESVEFEPTLPSLFIGSMDTITPTTAIIAATHDPKIDDLAMMAAVKTRAGYIGVMGSMKTSQARAERLKRTGGLSSEEIGRIHMPVGLNLGSKTPAEIALAIMADVLRMRRGQRRTDI